MEIPHSFNGKMALDNHPYKVKSIDFIEAWNITRDAVGVGQDKVVSTLVGNRISYYTLHSGINKVIGNKEDLLRNRIYFFVWNSENYHSILYYDKVNDAVYKLIESKTDSAGIDVLKFNPSFKINHIDIIFFLMDSGSISG